MTAASAAPAVRRFLLPRLRLASAGLAACSAAAWMGHTHWFAELFTHFAPHYAAAGLALAAALLMLRSFAWAVLPGTLAAVHAFSVFPWSDAHGAPAAVDDISIVQFNVRFDHEDPARVTQWLRSRDADVIVLLEVGPQWVPALAALRDAYPHQALQPLDSPFGVAVLSRIAPESIAVLTAPDDPYPYARVDLRMPRTGTPVRVFGVHPPPPVSGELAGARNAQLNRLAALAVNETQRATIVAGDFNATPWSPLYRSLLARGLKDGRPQIGAQNTWPAAPGAGVWGLAIDHTLVAGNAWIVRREVGPDLGSDHLPVRTQIAFGANPRAPAPR